MKRVLFPCRILSLLLSLSLGLPTPACALRQSGLEENRAKESFLKQIGHSSPAAGAEELSDLGIQIALELLGSSRIRSGKWGKELLPNLDPETATLLIRDSKRTLNNLEESWREKGWLKGGSARELLSGDIGNVQTRARLEVQRRAVEETRRLEAKQQAVAQWVKDKLQSAFKKAAISNWADVGSLQEVVQSFPDEPERTSLAQAVADFRQALVSIQSTGPLEGSEQERTLINNSLAIHWWNVHWFIPRQWILFRAGEIRTLETPADAAHLYFLGELQKTDSYSVMGQSIPIYFYRAILPMADVGGTFWDTVNRAIMIRTDAEPRYMARAAWDQQLPPTHVLSSFYRELHRRYLNLEALERACVQAVVEEEKRHSVDHVHLEQEVGKRIFFLGPDLARRFSETQLNSNGFLDTEIWQKLNHLDRQQAQNPDALRASVRDVQLSFGLIFIEMLRQFNRIASDPLIGIESWVRVLSAPPSREYFTTALLGMASLAHQLEMAQDPAPVNFEITPESHVVMNIAVTQEQMKSWAEQLSKIALQNPEKIRSAIEAVSARGFKHPVHISIPTSAGAEEDWQGLRKAAQAWKDKNWIADSEQFAEPFLVAVRVAKEKLGKAIRQKGNSENKIYLERLWRNRLETLRGFSLLVEAVTPADSASSPARRVRTKGEREVSIQVPSPRDSFLFDLKFLTLNENFPLVLIHVKKQFNGSFEEIGCLRIGRDLPLPTVNRPLLHLDLADGNRRRSWRGHDSLISAWSAFGNRGKALKAFQEFQEVFHQYLLHLPSIVPPAAGLSAGRLPDGQGQAGAEEKLETLLTQIATGRLPVADEIELLEKGLLTDSVQTSAIPVSAQEARPVVLQRIRILKQVWPAFSSWWREQLGSDHVPADTLWRVYIPFSQWLVEQKRRVRPGGVYVLGIQGTIGQGKTVFSRNASVLRGKRHPAS